MTGDALTPMAVLAGAAVGGGALLLVLAVRGLPVRPGAARAKRRREDLLRSLTTRGAIAVVAGALVLIVTRWPVAAVGAGLLVIGWRGIAGGTAEERKAMARLEALAAWTESLRDTIAGAVGLEQAIPSSLRAAAPALQPPLRTLVDRLHTRMAMPDALRRFADDLDDPSADLVIGALILNAKLRGPGLRDMLGALSTSARAELDMRRRVEGTRRTTRFSVLVVVCFSVGVALLLALTNRTYVRPYDGFTGQVVLSAVVALYALGFIWLRRLARFEMPQRFLGTVEDAPQPGQGVPAEVPATVAAWQQPGGNGAGTPNGSRLRGRQAMDAGGGAQ
ncbi:MAG TPA: type II secretion system F family protein [Streptosporangiaceae bacterium]